MHSPHSPSTLGELPRIPLPGSATLRAPDSNSTRAADGNPQVSQKGIGHRAMQTRCCITSIVWQIRVLRRLRGPSPAFGIGPISTSGAASHVVEADSRRQAKESRRLAAQAVPQEFALGHRRRRAEKSIKLRSSAGGAALKPEHHQYSDHDGQYQQSN